MNEQGEPTAASTVTATANLTEEQQSSNSNPPDQPATPRNRIFQNFFMQRMSDILTQLVASPETSNEEPEGTVTTNPPATETNPQPESPPTTTTTTSPDVQSPTSDENSATAISNTNADETRSETTRNV